MPILQKNSGIPWWIVNGGSFHAEKTNRLVIFAKYQRQDAAQKNFDIPFFLLKILKPNEVCFTFHLLFLLRLFYPHVGIPHPVEQLYVPAETILWWHIISMEVHQKQVIRIIYS